MKILDNIIEFIVLMFVRNVRDDHYNKFMNIITNIEETACTVYIIFKTLSSIKLEYNKNNGLIVYKSQ